MSDLSPRALRLLAIAMLVPFTALTAWAVIDTGVMQVFENQFATSGGIQVFVDLTIALTLLLAWLIPNARRTGRNPWPYVITTLIAGAFGPLLYCALTPREA